MNLWNDPGSDKGNEPSVPKVSAGVSGETPDKNSRAEDKNGNQHHAGNVPLPEGYLSHPSGPGNNSAEATNPNSSGFLQVARTSA